MRSLYKLLFLTLLIYLLEWDFLPNQKSSFTCSDPKLSQKFNGDTVTIKSLLLSSALLPLLILLSISYLKENSVKTIYNKTIENYYKKCFVGSLFVLLVTEIIKVIVKEPRPHFLESCAPDANKGCQAGSLVFEYNCTNSKLSSVYIIDLSRSFPSGHTSVSIFIAIYCTYVIQTYLKSEVGRRFTITFAKTALIMLCFCWSLLCSVSRIIDKQHHWWDVVAGAFLGSLAACYSINILRKEISEKNFGL